VTIAGLIAGAMALVAQTLDATAHKHHHHHHKKHRCQPRALGAACDNDQQCCPEKTGRICASNVKPLVRCDVIGHVCCLPFGASGCADSCDCCGADTVCSASGQCLKTGSIP
jgi:hypothetical protein